MPSIAKKVAIEDGSSRVLHIKGIPDSLRRSFNARAASLDISIRDAVIDAMYKWVREKRKPQSAQDVTAA